MLDGEDREVAQLALLKAETETSRTGKQVEGADRFVGAWQRNSLGSTVSAGGLAGRQQRNRARGRHDPDGSFPCKKGATGERVGGRLAPSETRSPRGLARAVRMVRQPAHVTIVTSNARPSNAAPPSQDHPRQSGADPLRGSLHRHRTQLTGR